MNRFWSVIPLSVCLSTTAAGQVEAPPQSFNPDFVCPQVDGGRLARVEYAAPQTGGTLGHVLACGKGGVRLDAYAGQPPQDVEVVSIHRLWTRRGSGLAGAIWGGIGGGLLGYAIASARTHVCAGPGAPGESDCHGDVGKGIAIGVIGGVGIGWFFGRGIPRWHLVYQAHS